MKNFNNIYEKVYREYGREIEEIRNKAKEESNMIIIMWIVLLLFTYPVSLIGGIFVFLVSLAYVLLIFYTIIKLINSKATAQFKKEYKEKIIGSFIKEYEEKLNYFPNEGVSSLIYRNAGFEGFDRFSSEDLITGTLNDKYKISLSEVHTERESTDEDGHTTYHTIFRGLFGVVDLDATIGTNVKIRRNNIALFDRKYKIEMDSQEFESIFNVYGTDKIATMQLLTSDVMQELIDFRKNSKILPEISIIADKLYIRFFTGNVFEPKIRQSAFDYSTLLKYYNIINFTLSITEKMIKNIYDTAEINGTDNEINSYQEKEELNKIEQDYNRGVASRRTAIAMIIFIMYIVFRIIFTFR
ncbi:MAG: DUF3137 domain-containing protein [Clostridia bacterium]|nr:DUF3137 domain-containing protein [Clostridia bacterium]